MDEKLNQYLEKNEKMGEDLSCREQEIGILKQEAMDRLEKIEKLEDEIEKREHEFKNEI